MAKAQIPPDLGIPESKNIVTVSIIDSTGFIVGDRAAFMEPVIEGTEKLTACCYSFKIQNDNPEVKSKYDTMIFDLGLRKDLENSSKVTYDLIKNSGWDIRVEKNVYDILKENGDNPADVGAVIWSHHHLDHTGDPSTFPPSTDLIVGPGFKSALLPGYPADQESALDSKAWEGRNLREIDFATEGKGLQIGQYNAFDFYGDGSFYLLDTPGHAVGHICGLARTSVDPTEFIFMGGDIAHHGAEFRPSPYLPLPKEISLGPLFSKNGPMCLGSMFENIHPKKSSTEPFFVPTHTGVHADAAEAKRSIEKMYEFDADERVFINIAHDTSIYDLVDFYPKTANGWSAKGWREEGRWRFLKDLEDAARAKDKQK